MANWRILVCDGPTMSSAAPDPSLSGVPPEAPQRWRPALVRAVLALSLLGGAGGALLLGQDGGFDLKNYHYYNAWALLGGRLGHDFVVAQQQTWFNPLMDLLYYVPVKWLGPRAGSALMGALQGLNLWLLFLLAGRLLPGGRQGWSGVERHCMALAVLFAGVCGPITWANLGSSRGDLTVSLFVLSSLLVLLEHPLFVGGDAVGGRSPRRLVVASGLLMGLGCGLKLTALSFAVGAALSLVVVGSKSIKDRIRTSTIWSGAMCGAFLVTGGPWMAVLWQHYGSPIFPFANHIIGSPYAPDASFAEVRFRPDGIDQFLAFPLQFAAGGEVAWEFAFRDPRLALLYLLLVFCLVRVLWIRFGPGAGVESGRTPAPPALTFAVVFAASSYLVWQVAFCVYRYLAPLELLAPLLLVALLAQLLPRPAVSLAAAAATLVVIVACVQMPTVERLPWQDDIFGVQLPEPAPADNSVVVLAGDDATSYLATYFPPAIRFLRIAGNFGDPEDGTLLSRDMRAVLDTSDGPLYFLKGPYAIDHDSLHTVGLELQAGSCRAIRSRVDDNLALCGLSRR